MIEKSGASNELAMSIKVDKMRIRQLQDERKINALQVQRDILKQDKADLMKKNEILKDQLNIARQDAR